MFIIHFHSRGLKPHRSGRSVELRYKARAANISEVYQKIMRLRNQGKMHFEICSGLKDDQNVFVQMANDKARVWLYAFKIENGPDAWIDKIKQALGMEHSS